MTKQTYANLALVLLADAAVCMARVYHSIGRRP